MFEIGPPDQFDNWAYNRDRLYDESGSARYVSDEVVGYEDLDDYGDWRDDSNYGHVWFPNRIAAGWSPYHEGHWVWISPWGYTWVDDSPWGYAPFHYGRWVTVGGRWGWVAGPVAVRAVYAPALVVFIGGGGVGFGGNVGWFPLGPREVYVPSHHVSREYVNRVNISNTTVNNVQITNVYNTTIINKTTKITNITYANRNVRGAVTAVPQRAFASAQPVGRAAVAINARQIARATVSPGVAVAPTRDSVLGATFSTANRVTAPPQAVMNRRVIARRTPPPPPVPFAKQQQSLAAHPGQPLARSEVRKLRRAAAEASHPMVKQAPPGKPATAKVGRLSNQPNAARPGQVGSTPPANQPANRPANPAQPNRLPSTQSNQPAPSQPNNRPDASKPHNRPGTSRPPTAPTNNQPNQPNNQPDVTRPQKNRPTEAPARNDRLSVPKPNNRPETARPVPSQPESNRNQPTPRPHTFPGAERQQQRTPASVAPKPAAPTQSQQPKAQTPSEKKQEQERRKPEQQKPPESRRVEAQLLKGWMG